ncbi:MAG: hypothetical protein GXO75_08335 [Calditrichaeota bacterium]|nr:hypothetical protein [Calditrichota bacterium]
MSFLKLFFAIVAAIVAAVVVTIAIFGAAYLTAQKFFGIVAGGIIICLAAIGIFAKHIHDHA